MAFGVTVALFFLSNPSAGQPKSILSPPDNVEVFYGPEIKSKKNALNQIIRTFGADQQGNNYRLRLRINAFSFSEPLQYYLEKYGSDTKLISSNKLLLEGLSTTYMFQDMFYINDRFYLLVNSYDKETSVHTLYATMVEKSGEVDPNLQKTSEFVSPRRMIQPFSLAFSSDRSKLFVKKPQKDENRMEVVSYDVYNVAFTDKMEFSNVWSKDIVLPYRDRKYAIQGTIVDNDGNIHLLSQVGLERDDKKEGIPKSFYEMFSYFHRNDEMKHYKVDIGEHYISDITIIQRNADNVSGAGLYKSLKGNLVEGVFYFDVNIHTGSLERLAQQRFPAAFATEFLTPKQAAKGKNLTDFKTRWFISQADGGGFLVAEYYNMEITSQSLNDIAYSTTRWWYEDLIVCRFNPDGTVAWFRKVPKKQKSSVDSRSFTGIGGPQYMGISVFYMHDKLRILYNDHPDNLAETSSSAKMKYMQDPKTSITTLVTIDADGTLTKSPLFDARNRKTIVMPTQFVRVNDNTIVLIAGKRKKTSFIRVTFKPDRGAELKKDLSRR